MKKFLRLWMLVCVLALLGSTLSKAQAATKTWDGGGADNNWTTAANWDLDTAPVAGDSLVFAGTVRPTAVNNFAANTNFSGITFSAGAGAFVLSGNAVNIAGDITNSATNVQTISLPLVLTAAQNVTGSGTSLVISGAISGAFSLTKAGTGSVSLSTTNTYSGGTTVSAGNLSLLGTSNVGSGAVAVTGGGLTIGSNTVNAGSALAVGNTVTVSSGASLTIAQQQTAALTYTTFPINLNGNATLRFSGSNVNTFNIPSPITLNNTGSAGSQVATIGEGNAADTVNLQGVISGTGDLKIAPGGIGSNPFTVTLSQAATYSGNTSVFTSGGDKAIIKLLAGGSLPSTTSLSLQASGTTFTANLDLNGQSQTLSGLTSAGTLTSDLVINSTNGTTAALTINTVGAPLYSGSIGSSTAGLSNISLTKSGTGALILGGVNYYSAGTTISNGTIQMTGSGTLGSTSGPLTINGGTLDLNGISQTVGVLSGTTTVKAIDNGANNTSTLTVGTGSGSGSFGGIIADTANIFTGTPVVALVKAGTGTQTLTGANTYSGTTTVSAGTLQIGSGGTSGTLGTAGVTDNATLAFNRSDTVSVSNLISGSGIVKQSGTGTTILTTANSYAGATTISAGTLRLGVSKAAGNTTVISIAGSGTLSLRADADTIFGDGTTPYPVTTTANGASINVDRATGTSPSVNLTIGTLTLNTAATNQTNITGTTGASLVTGAVTGGTSANGTETIANNISGGGSLTLASFTTGRTGTPTLVFSGTGNTSVTGAITQNAANTMGLTYSGSGTLTLGGTNTYTGITTISSGVLQVGTGGVAGTLGTGNVTDNATLVFNRSDSVAVPNLIGGTGALTQSGAGTLTLTNTETYTGATTIGAGILQIGDGTTDGNIATSAAIVDNGTLAYNRMSTASAFTYANIISGTGTVTKSGAGTQILTGANTYSGGTTVTGGVLGGTGTLGGATTFAAGTTHSPGVSGPGIQAVNGNYSNAGTLALDLNGATAGTGYDQVNVAGTVTVTGSTLSLASTGFTPSVGQVLVIVNNDDTDAVVGTFAGLAEGSTVTVGGTFYTISYVGGTGNDITLTPLASASSGALIGEFRAHGSSGATDEYIELSNSTTSPVSIGGWSVKYLSGGSLVMATVPANTTLVPLGHYLFTGSGYNATLSGISGSDQTLANPMDDATGITLFNAGSTVVDSVSFAGSSMAGEGTLLPSAPTADGEYAFERRQSSGNPAGVPLDNNNNSGDFIFVSTTGATLASVTGDGTTATTLASTLGAPSPNSTIGYVQVGSVALSLLDTSVANTASPNRVRLNAVDSGVVGAPDRFGTLRLRRTLTNNGSTTYTRVRFHVVTITTLNGGGYSDPTQADVRLLTSPDETGVATNTGAKNVIGTSVQAPATLAVGGGLNANTVVLNQALTPGSSANYSFELGVARKGNFLVGFTIELLP